MPHLSSWFILFFFLFSFIGYSTTSGYFIWLLFFALAFPSLPFPSLPFSPLLLNWSLLLFSLSFTFLPFLFCFFSSFYFLHLLFFSHLFSTLLFSCPNLFSSFLSHPVSSFPSLPFSTPFSLLSRLSLSLQVSQYHFISFLSSFYSPIPLFNTKCYIHPINTICLPQLTQRWLITN